MNLRFWTWHRRHSFLKDFHGLTWILHFLLCNMFEYRDIVKHVPRHPGSYFKLPTLYLRRWFLVRHGKYRSFLHNILRSDDDRWPHDHPWKFRTFCLWNGYSEEIVKVYKDWDGKPASCSFYLPFRTGDYQDRDLDHIHRVTLWRGRGGREMPAWTLVFPEEATRHWGFWKDTEWIPWWEFLNLPKPDPSETPWEDLPESNSSIKEERIEQ